MENLDKVVKERRERAIKLLEASLALGVKPIKRGLKFRDDEVETWSENATPLTVRLTAKDIEKKQKELATLKT